MNLPIIIENFQDNNITDDISLMTDGDEMIILFRAIFCCISLFLCFLVTIIYIIFYLQTKNLLCFKKDNENRVNYFSDNFDSDSNNIKSEKIGLGSNFILYITLSNFFGSFFEFLFYFYYINKKKNYENSIQSLNKLYIEINNDKTCHFYAVSHNIFDLFSACWITMLTLLFYKSTKPQNEMLLKRIKYTIIGFIYSILSCIIFCILPLMTNSYGFVRYFCSFTYQETYMKENGLIETEKKITNTIWRYIFSFFEGINTIFHVIFLIITKNFYSKQLEDIKGVNKKGYKSLLIYIWIFRMFPIILMVSRLYKIFSRFLREQTNDDNIKNIFEYLNGFVFASNGIFNSIACLFFFRSFFSCFSSDEELNSSSVKKSYKLHEIIIDD